MIEGNWLPNICAVISPAIPKNVLYDTQTLSEALMGEGVYLSIHAHQRVRHRLLKAGYTDVNDSGSSRFSKPDEIGGVMSSFDEAEGLFLWVAFSA